MPQISKNPIHKDVFFNIRDDFLWVLSEIRTSGDVKTFFYDFFTKTERIMLAKRFAVAMMIQEGYQYTDIQYILHVSTSTITNVAHILDQGAPGMKRIITKLAREEKSEAFWKKVNRFLDEYVSHPRIVHDAR